MLSQAKLAIALKDIALSSPNLPRDRKDKKTEASIIVVESATLTKPPKIYFATPLSSDSSLRWREGTTTGVCARDAGLFNHAIELGVQIGSDYADDDKSSQLAIEFMLARHAADRQPLLLRRVGACLAGSSRRMRPPI